jgi:hypothetical protein
VQIDFTEFQNWIVKHEVHILNFAGPRESYAKGIYSATLNFLKNLQSFK